MIHNRIQYHGRNVYSLMVEGNVIVKSSKEEVINTAKEYGFGDVELGLIFLHNDGDNTVDFSLNDRSLITTVFDKSIEHFGLFN